MAKDTKLAKRRIMRQIASNNMLHRSGMMRGFGGTREDAPVGPFVCAYVIDSNDALAIGFGLDGAVDMTGPQVGQVVAQGGSISETRLSSSSSLAEVDFTSGKTVVEMLVESTTPTLVAGQLAADLRLVDMSIPNFVAGIRILVTSTGANFVVSRAGGAAVATGSTTLPCTAGIEVDADTGTFRAIINDVDIALSNDAIAVNQFIIALQTAESLISDAGDVGEIVTGTVRTSASDFTNTYAAGAKDVCGNTIP